MLRRISRNFVSACIDANKGFDISFFVTETFEMWSLNTHTRCLFLRFCFRCLAWYAFRFSTHLMQNFFNDLLCVDWPHGHPREVLPMAGKSPYCVLTAN